MGISATTHVGPFIRCKTVTVASTYKKRLCSNPDCKKSSPDNYEVSEQKKYCSTCGSMVASREFPTEKKNVTRNEICELIGDDTFWTGGDSLYFQCDKENITLYMPNRYIPNTRKFTFYPRDEVLYLPLTAENIQKETEEFTAFYQKEIDILREKYGAENVEVLWGVVNDLS